MALGETVIHTPSGQFKTPDGRRSVLEKIRQSEDGWIDVPVGTPGMMSYISINAEHITAVEGR